jgi:hypothetical protein
MDRVSNEELFSVILSSNILSQYLQIDPELAALLENPNHCNIHYPSSHASVERITPILQGMLDYMQAQRIYMNVEATKQLIGYGEKNPDGLVYDITFNCERQSYGVCCGLAQNQLQVICVLTGNHIPDELFGDSIL